MKYILLFIATVILAACQTPTPTPAARPLRVIMQPTATPTATATPLHVCTVTAQALTVRACGAVTCQAVGWLGQGEIVTTTQVISGWIPAGAGWVNSKFCQEVK